MRSVLHRRMRAIEDTAGPILIGRAKSRGIVGNTADLSLLDWSKRFLGKYTTLEWNDLHRTMAADVDRARGQRGSRLAYLGPRDTGKSIVLSLATPLRAVLERWKRYVLIVSETAQLAEKLLAPISEEIEFNPEIAAAYPGAAGRGPVWQQGKIRLRNGVLIEALGQGKSLRGSRNQDIRPDLIIVDDLQGDDHLWSPRLRQRTQTWFDGGLLKVGDPTCDVLVGGNAIHRDCVVCKLGERPNWRGSKFRYIIEWPARMDLWGEWESILNSSTDPDRAAKADAFYNANREEMHRGAVLLWPERYGLLQLMLERASEGHSAFERERQANPTSPDSVEWPDELFEGNDLWFDAWPDDCPTKVLFIDPSTGRDAKKSDYSAIVMVGHAVDGNIYVDADLARRPIHQIASDAIGHYQAFRGQSIGAEDVFMQEWVRAEIHRQAVELGVLIPCNGLRPDAAKPTRIRRLGPYLSQRRLRFKKHSRGSRLLFDQLREFPNADHDDGPDALEGAIRMIVELSRE